MAPSEGSKIFPSSTQNFTNYGIIWCSFNRYFMISEANFVLDQALIISSSLGQSEKSGTLMGDWFTMALWWKDCRKKSKWNRKTLKWGWHFQSTHLLSQCSLHHSFLTQSLTVSRQTYRRSKNRWRRWEERLNLVTMRNYAPYSCHNLTEDTHTHTQFTRFFLKAQ